MISWHLRSRKNESLVQVQDAKVSVLHLRKESLCPLLEKPTKEFARIHFTVLSHPSTPKILQVRSEET